MERQVAWGFAKAFLVTFAGVAVFGFVTTPSAFHQSLAKTWAYQPPPEKQHDCSGYTKAMLIRNYAPEQRAVMWRQLCDEGGEKAIEDMIDARKAELAKPAF